VLPFLRIVTESGICVPRIDLALVIRHQCETYWRQTRGADRRLYLRLQPLILDLDRVGLLTQSVRALLTGGLSPGFSPQHGGIGVHLWSVDLPGQVGILLIADSGTEWLGEPSTPSITEARQYAEKAGCCLVWQPAHGAVWRIHIPTN
jgi:hypothetical protein